MSRERTGGRTTPRVVEALYVEAMLLADEARSYFDGPGRQDRDALSPMARVSFSCESLRVTTRLMHVIAWLLTRKAIEVGEMDRSAGAQRSMRLGEAGASDPAIFAILPPEALQLIEASIDLHARVGRIDRELAIAESAGDSPALTLMRRLEDSL